MLLQKIYWIVTFRLHLKHDADILEYLGTKESVNRYLKDLIREDIERQKKGGRVGPLFCDVFLMYTT